MKRLSDYLYFTAYATKQDGSYEEVATIKPTAENIANFIMKHFNCEIMITDFLDLPFIKAGLGLIHYCRDTDILIHEILPVITPIQKNEKEIGEIELYEVEP